MPWTRRPNRNAGTNRTQLRFAGPRESETTRPGYRGASWNGHVCIADYQLIRSPSVGGDAPSSRRFLFSKCSWKTTEAIPKATNRATENISGRCPCPAMTGTQQDLEETEQREHEADRPRRPAPPFDGEARKASYRDHSEEGADQTAHEQCRQKVVRNDSTEEGAGLRRHRIHRNPDEPCNDARRHRRQDRERSDVTLLLRRQLARKEDSADDPVEVSRLEIDEATEDYEEHGERKRPSETRPRRLSTGPWRLEW